MANDNSFFDRSFSLPRTRPDDKDSRSCYRLWRTIPMRNLSSFRLGSWQTCGSAIVLGARLLCACMTLTLLGCGSSSSGDSDAGKLPSSEAGQDAAVTLVPFTDWPAAQDVPSQCTGKVYWMVSVDECECGTMAS